MQKPINVFVVDDHPTTRKGLCDAIAEEPDLRICGEADSWHSARKQVPVLKPSLMVLDLNLKDGNGWTLLTELKAAQCLPPTLVLSVCDEEIYAQRLLQAGARGYLMKEEPIATILAALRRIAAGHVVVSDRMTTRILLESSGVLSPEARLKQELNSLSDRELQVFEMIGRGLGNKEIAQSLGIGAKTIGTYKARLMEKLGASTTPGLTFKARQSALGMKDQLTTPENVFPSS